jgi:hypothetical protein
MKIEFKVFALMILAVLSICVLGQNSCYIEDFTNFRTGKNPSKTWFCKNVSAKTVNGSLRLTEIGKKQYGTMHRYIPYRKGYNYLQIKLGTIENIGFAAKCVNCSTGGRAFGMLFSGWNTFDMKAQKFYNKRNAYFALSIMKFGPSGEKNTGWIDFECIRVVKIPVNGITIDLKQSQNKTDRIARVGDRILFRYFSPEKLQNNPELSCYYTKWMEPFLFNGSNIVLNDDGKNGDVNAGDKIYSAEVTIGDKTPSLNITEKQRYFLAAISNQNIKSNAISSFGFDIKTKVQLKRSSVVCGTPTTRKYRSLWQKRTKGKNLALGKKVKFSLKSNYRLTYRGNTDATDLTDGKLSANKDDRIWYGKDAVGWYQGAAKGINMLIDLKKTEDIKKLVVRVLAGQSKLGAPNKLEVFVSKDGKDFYRTASLQKLMPAEANQSDFKQFYYLPETGLAYVYPFELPVNADARYVVLRLTGCSGWLFLDEIALIAAENKDKAFNAAYSRQAEKIYFSGIVVKPTKSTLAISRNIITPVFLDVQDMRKPKNANKPVKVEIEVPEGVALLYPKSQKAENLNKYIISNLKTKKLFFKVKKLSIGNYKAKITSSCDGEKAVSLEYPLEVIDIPAVPKLKRLHVSFAWFTMSDAMKWPEFFNAWSSMGFNAVSTFPRYWRGKVTPKQKVFLAKARNHGLKIVMNSSPWWGTMRLKLPAGSEVYSQVPGKKCKYPCPGYRGKYYKKEMDRIKNCVSMIKPDYVFWDIECWDQSAKNVPACKTCKKAMQEKNAKNVKEYLAICGEEHMRDLYNAVREGIGKEKMPVVATYDNEPLEPLYQSGIYNWNKIYPKYVKLAKPSLYVVGDARKVHDSIRQNHKLMKNKKIIPWLTGGAYGEFDPRKIEYMIYETLLNGAMGITYCHFWDFDTPKDYYYHAKALKTIAPFEDLIMDGKVLEPTGSNKKLYYSGVKKGNEMLLLIGNYDKSNEETTVNLPFQSITKVCDLMNSQKIAASKQLKLTVPKGKIRLLHIKCN